MLNTESQKRFQSSGDRLLEDVAANAIGLVLCLEQIIALIYMQRYSGNLQIICSFKINIL